MAVIIEHKEDMSSNFEGTVIDIETIGEFNKSKSYKIFNDSRQCEDIQQVILGFINRKGINIFCARGEEGIRELVSQTRQILDGLNRPFYAFNADFESSVWFHHIGTIINFDGELQKFKFEKKAEARSSLSIPNYDDPFNDDGLLCSQAWRRGEFDKAIKHNRACLLKERDILLMRDYREPNTISFNK